MKEVYSKPETEVIEITEDVITTSGQGNETFTK